MTAPLVVGVDIGTTSTKAVGFDTDGLERAVRSVGYPLREPESGAAEQDPDEIVRAVRETVRGVVADIGRPVAGLSFSGAMHSLIGLDAAGRPLTPSFTWADTRAQEDADVLRADPGPELYRRTGTPLHPMAPLAKLRWLRRTRPDVFARVAHWVGIKEYVLSRLTGRLVVDQSTASGTGLLDVVDLDWDDEAIRLASITRERLPDVVPSTTVLDGLLPSVARDLDLPSTTPVVVGAGDGPLANLGAGAIRPGVAACSIGTSGALRLAETTPDMDPAQRLFCYVLTPGRWIVGGATTNGGLVLAWAGAALAPDLGPLPESALLDLASAVPAGADGLLMLPYLQGERAPYWSSVPRGAYVGLTRKHGRGHLVRAALEGVCLHLALVRDTIRAAGHEVRELRATGGFTGSPVWRQMLADVLGQPVGLPRTTQASACGAALLGLYALETLPSLDAAADLVTVAQTIEPEPAASGRYAALRPVFAQAYEQLLPTFRVLGQQGTSTA